MQTLQYLPRFSPARPYLSLIKEVEKTEEKELFFVLSGERGVYVDEIQKSRDLNLSWAGEI